MKLIWLTDIHLNFLTLENRMEFYQKVVAASGDKILISGDIPEAPSVSEILKEMAKTIQKPIYFVLGNHDYYRGKIDSLRKEIHKLIKNEPLGLLRPIPPILHPNNEPQNRFYKNPVKSRVLDMRIFGSDVRI